MTRATPLTRLTGLDAASVALASSVPRPGKARNEDLVAVADGLAVALDGASVPAGMPACCERDAAWYVRQPAAAIIGTLTAAPTLGLKAIEPDLCARILDQLRHGDGHGDGYEHPAYREALTVSTTRTPTA